jgi:hypothetical protein
MLYVYSSGALVNRIARELNITSAVPNKQRIVRRKNSTIVPINWGCAPNVMRAIAPNTTLNYNIGNASSKLNALRTLSAASIQVPPFSTQWQDIAARGRYLARKDHLTGGAGIEIVEKDQAPKGEYDFLSLVVAKALEFRIHVFRGNIICEQFKFMPQGSKALIRSYDNGARFSNKALEEHLSPEAANQARQIAIRAVESCGLQFGAVDMFLSARAGHIYVLEINTAPGIARFETLHGAPHTYSVYLEAFRSMLVREG